MVALRTRQMLPEIDALRRLSQSLAMLDAIISPEWEYRYYSFNSKWGLGEMMASMRNGSGDDYFLLFNTAGAILKGFAHESPMSPYANEEHKIWPGVLDRVPTEFAFFLSEPAFTMKDTTFCLWRRYTNPGWQVGEIEYPTDDLDPDGSDALLAILDGRAATYQEFAESYYERSVNLSIIESIYHHQPLTQELISALNPGLSLEDLAADILEIAYPSSPAP
jgi:hypothetical protein